MNGQSDLRADVKLSGHNRSNLYTIGDIVEPWGEVRGIVEGRGRRSYLFTKDGESSAFIPEDMLR